MSKTLLIKNWSSSKRVTLYDLQASHFVACIKALDEDRLRTIGPRYNPEAGDPARLWSLRSYRIFHDAAYVCGFVLDGLAPDFPLSEANKSPQRTLGEIPFPKLRHYVHTLMRAERSSAMDGYFSPVLESLVSGALLLVASRLEQDRSLYDSDASLPMLFHPS